MKFDAASFFEVLLNNEDGVKPKTRNDKDGPRVNRAKSYDGAEALLDNQFKHNQDETGAGNREEEEDADIESDIDEEEVD